MFCSLPTEKGRWALPALPQGDLSTIVVRFLGDMHGRDSVGVPVHACDVTCGH